MAETEMVGVPSYDELARDVKWLTVALADRNAKIESDAKVIAALRERMTQIRAFVSTMSEANWRDIGVHIARQAAVNEQTAGESK